MSAAAKVGEVSNFLKTLHCLHSKKLCNARTTHAVNTVKKLMVIDTHVFVLTCRSAHKVNRHDTWVHALDMVCQDAHMAQPLCLKEAGFLIHMVHSRDSRGREEEPHLAACRIPAGAKW